MNPTYPNLELIEYKFRQALNTDEEFMEKVNKIKSESKHFFADYDVVVFPQVWGSTCTGFDECKDGLPAIGGSAMTKEYTTVICENRTQTFAVFFGNRICYLVTDANENFMNDLKNQNMSGLHLAKSRY